MKSPFRDVQDGYLMDCNVKATFNREMKELKTKTDI